MAFIGSSYSIEHQQISISCCLVKMASEAQQTPNSEQNIFRPLANFPASVWGFSLASLSSQNSEYESYTQQVEALKQKVKDMLIASTVDPAKNIEFIDLLCQLGVSYHFDNEIEEHLNRIFQALPDLLNTNNYGLCTFSTLFRVLRQHGFQISSDVFKKFKDSRGEFKKTIMNDVEGILSFYEASHLSMHGEDILDEAFMFTRSNLENQLPVQSSPHLTGHIKNALVQPFHQGMPRIEARKFISFYEKCDSQNHILLKFAKLDYNRVLSLHQQELGIVSRWWKDLDVVDKLPYARDRIAETYFWGAGINFEPQYALVRILVAKFLKILSLIDDTYDAYGTFEETQHLTEAIDRFDSHAIDHLPADYLKTVYSVLLNLFDEMECLACKQGRSHLIIYVKEELKQVVRGYHQEAKWVNDGYVPMFSEYMTNGLITSTLGALLAVSFLGLGEIAGINEFEWLRSVPRIVKASQLITRLKDDLMTHQDERKRGFCIFGVDCYVKEYGVSEKEATEELQKMIANAWKDINEEFMRPTTLSKLLLMHVVNHTRIMEVVYKFHDGYSHSLFMKDDIISLFLEPLQI